MELGKNIMRIFVLTMTALTISCGNSSPTEWLEEDLPNRESETRSEWEEAATAILPSLNLVERIGQTLIIQIRYRDSGAGVTILSASDIAILRTVKPGGIILFKENIDSVSQLTKLLHDIKQYSPYPPFIAVDEEGGSVSRLLRSGKIPATPIPAASRIAASGNARSAYLAYSIIGRELAVLGFNMNFAPVADIFSNPQNDLIASRSFGTEPDRVAEMVAEAVRALQEQGVVSVIKHFPGHGDSSGDSHFTIPVLNHDLQRLMEFELQPFFAGMEAGAGGFLMAHLSFPSIDNSPASFSPVFIQTVIRETMAYDGLLLTDALEMRGAGNIGNAHETGLMALQAGADILLIPPDPRKQRDVILAAILDGRLSLETLNRAVIRVIASKLKHTIWRGPPSFSESEVRSILGSAEHAAMLQEALQPLP